MKDTHTIGRRNYFVEKANEVEEVRTMLIAMKFVLSASGLHHQEFNLLLTSAITKLTFAANAFAQEANFERVDTKLGRR